MKKLNNDYEPVQILKEKRLCFKELRRPWIKFLPFQPPLSNKPPLYIDLEMVKHIAGVYIYNNDLGVIWTAPWHIKIPEGVLKAVNNQLTIEVTNVSADRLIGDEEQPADCEWIPGYMKGGYSLKKFPDWFLKKEPRPSKGRYCFTTWNYFTKDTP